MLKICSFVEVSLYLLENNTAMKKYLLSLSAIVIGTAFSFGQQEEITPQKAEVMKTEAKAVKSVKVKNIKKAEKINPANVKIVQAKAVNRKKATKVEGKKED